MSHHLSMPTKASKQWEARHTENLRQMREGLKQRGIRKSQRQKLIDAAAAGRPADLAEQAQAALRARREAQASASVQRDLDIIAGRVKA